MDRWLVKVFWDIKLHINILLTFCLNYDNQSLFTHRNENLQEAATTQFPLECLFNQRQLFLQMCCLCSLWNFGETIDDRRFLLSKDIFPLSVDALLLQTVPLKETSHIDMSSMVVNVNETAIGCFAG